jgi:hypothetical protein
MIYEQGVVVTHENERIEEEWYNKNSSKRKLGTSQKSYKGD